MDVTTRPILTPDGTEKFLGVDASGDIYRYTSSGSGGTLVGTTTPSDYGLIANGASNPLSSVYGTLEEAQAAFDGAYYFVNSLDQQIDWAACKAASNDAFGPDLDLTAYNATAASGTNASGTISVVGNTDVWTADEHTGKEVWLKYTANGYIQKATVVSHTTKSSGGNGTLTVSGWTGPFGVYDWDTGDNATEYAFSSGGGENASLPWLNKKLILPRGDYWFGDDTWLIRNLQGGFISGSGCFTTVLRGNKTLLAFDGIWYSWIEHIAFILQATDGIAAFEMDGNVPGHPYATRGVQGNMVQNCYFDGGDSLYAVAFNRLGGDSGQGDHCCFLKNYYSRGSFACFYQHGFNSINNQIYGGNCADYPRYGFYSTTGSFAVRDVSFQCQTQHIYDQYVNDGYDIEVGSSGVFDPVVVSGVSSESLRLFRNRGGVLAKVEACNGRLSAVQWFASTAYGPSGSARVIKAGTAANAVNRFWEATTPGTSGTSEPNWNAVAVGGTVSDGTIVWTERVIDWILSDDVNATTVETDSCATYVGRINAGAPNWSTEPRFITFASSAPLKRISARDKFIYVDCSAGEVTLTLDDTTPRTGVSVMVIKTDSTENECVVTVPQWGIAGGWYDVRFGRGQKAMRWIACPTQVQDGSGTAAGGYEIIAAFDHASIGDNAVPRVLTAAQDIDNATRDSFLIYDTTSGNITQELPPASYWPGKRITFKKSVAANTLTIEGDGSETIDGAANYAMTAIHSTVTLVSAKIGSTWQWLIESKF
jgi:hypothetical protein